MTETPTDKPRSRTPKTPPPETAPAQIDINWRETATQMLKAHAWQDAQQLRDRRILGGREIYRASAGAKRAHNLVVRQAITRALQTAPPLYPALIAHLETMEVAAQWQLNVQFVDDAEMQTINLDTRGKDKPTDVLSFPAWEGETFPFPPGQSEITLGDMVISVETAIRQSEELKHGLRAELAFLSIHGTLHLLGYDHDNGGARRRMFGLQDQIFARLREEKGF